jgi:hypothetical protein
MGLEAGNFIDDLNADWPLGTDPVAEGDDHLRLIKRCLQGNVAGDATTTSLLSTALAKVVAESTGGTTDGQFRATEPVPIVDADLTRKDYVDAADLVLQGQVDTLDGEVSTLQGEVLTLQGEVSTLQSDVTGLQTQIDNILNGTTPFTGDVDGTDWIANGP